MKKNHSLRILFGLCLLLFSGIIHPIPSSAQTDTNYECQPPAPHRAAALSSAIMRGDLDNDGERSIVDVTIMVEYITNSTLSFEYKLGDMNDDGDISLTDITILVNIILGGEYTDPDNPTFPVGGNEGGDPSTGL